MSRSTYAVAMMRKFIFALSFLALFTGCAHVRQHEPLPTVERVDLDRFMGTWYVIGMVPNNILDRKPYNATETYSRASKGISITYAFNAGSFDGKQKSYTVRAMVDDPGINADWEVRYITWPFESDYRIIHLEPDYSVAVIGQSSRKRVWILSRDKQINDTLYSDITLYLQDLGYDVGKIHTVRHQ